MTMSPSSSRGPRSLRVGSTAAAGTISQTALGLFSFFTKSSSDDAPMRPP